MSVGWSQSYSFLEPGENERAEMGLFSGLKDDTGIRCTPETHERKGGGGGAANSSSKPSPYSNYLTNRDNDTEVLRNQQLSKSSPQGLRR